MNKSAVNQKVLEALSDSQLKDRYEFEWSFIKAPIGMVTYARMMLPYIKEMNKRGLSLFIRDSIVDLDECWGAIYGA